MIVPRSLIRESAARVNRISVVGLIRLRPPLGTVEDVMELEHSATGLDRLAEVLRFSSKRRLLIELCIGAIGLPFAWLGTQLLIEARSPVLRMVNTPLAMVLITALLLPLILRYRFPNGVLLVVLGVFIAVRELRVPELSVSSIALVVAMHTAGRYGRHPWRTVTRLLVLVATLVILIRLDLELLDAVNAGQLTRREFYLIAVADLISSFTLLGLTWWWGNSSRLRFERERELAARTLELEASREENSRRAVMDERIRIAREIHDVVAHHVSVMGVQAGAARTLISRDPGLAEEPLRAIESSSREAVAELHRLLGFLRRTDDPDPDGTVDLEPQPGLSRLPELRKQLAAAGLAVRLRVEGAERTLPPSVDLNAYRIIQEGLTNALKYSGVDQAEVSLNYHDDELAVYIGDRGRGPVSMPADRLGGAGLPGMAERVALLGGALSHGARQGGGFEVSATLPYSGKVEAAPQVSAVAP